jgi:hypothetical protein
MSMESASNIQLEKPSRDILYPFLCITLATAPWFIVNFFPNHLDSKFKELGFCQSTKIRQGYDSFEICFWVDLIGSLLLYFLVILLGNRISSSDRNEMISSVPSTIMHGIVHYYQYLNQGKFSFNEQDPMKPYREGPWYMYAGNFAFIMGFQYNLQTSVGNFKSMLGASMAINVFQLLFVPPVYGLTYVNTWIFITDILVKCFKPITRKSDFGDTLSKIIIIILLIEPIIEATKCENGLENYGGHAVFDSWIVFYEFFSLALAYYRENNRKKIKSN